VSAAALGEQPKDLRVGLVGALPIGLKREAPAVDDGDVGTHGELAVLQLDPFDVRVVDLGERVRCAASF
jgi:hypothetical protein